MTQPVYLAVDHPRFRRVERALFERHVVADCMNHTCHMVGESGRAFDRPRRHLDACCQYGADADITERDAILSHYDDIAPLLDADARVAPWFTDEVEVDPDFPSGRHVRTARFGDGCLFLSHDGRGCAIHRAAVEGDWDFHGVKPHVCRLFPLSYDRDTICLSDDYEDYDCADHPGAPTLYRVARDTLAAVFGAELVAALDAIEAALGAAPAPRLVQLRTA